MRFSSGTSRWWIAAYLAVTLACTAGWLVLGQRLTEQTGLRRQVWLANDFQGIPVINDVAREPTLDFLDDDPRLPREVHQRPVERVLVRSEPSVVHTACCSGRLRRHLDRRGITGCSEFRGGAGSTTSRRWRPRTADCLPTVRWRHPISRSPEDQRMRTRYRSEQATCFPTQPEPNLLRLVGIVDRLKLTVGILWAAGALAAAGALTAAVFILWRRRYRTRWTEVAFACVVGVISLSAVIARLPGWNPESLWDDDVIFGSLIRSSDLYSLITTPIHHAPGLFLVWRGFYEIFPDPEWSLQILPFACGIAAIPVMALLGRRLTGDASLGVLAGALTALNPLLAYYTVVVHEYSFEFLLTALFLLGAVTIGGSVLRGIDPGRFCVACAGRWRGDVLLRRLASCELSNPAFGCTVRHRIGPATRALWDIEGAVVVGGVRHHGSCGRTVHTTSGQCRIDGSLCGWVHATSLADRRHGVPGERGSQGRRDEHAELDRAGRSSLRFAGHGFVAVTAHCGWIDMAAGASAMPIRRSGAWRHLFRGRRRVRLGTLSAGCWSYGHLHLPGRDPAFHGWRLVRHGRTAASLGNPTARRNDGRRTSNLPASSCHVSRPERCAASGAPRRQCPI